MHRIMLVDDEVLLTMQLEESLSGMGYEFVGKASSGENAVGTAKRLRPDLVLMDIVMPGKLDGIDAAKIIKAELDIPVIFLTAYADDKFVNRAKNVEPFGYVLKPFQEGELKAAIEIALYKKDMEKALRKAHDELKRQVEECTTELLVANKKLKQGTEDRKQAEQTLKEKEKELEIKTRSLQEIKTALGVLLKRWDEDKKELEEKVLFNINELVVPHLGKLRKSGLDTRQKAYVTILESNLNDIISPFLRTLSHKYLDLTHAEIQVANLVKKGKTTKEIAELLNSSTRAIEFHRNNLRKKLGLKSKKANLRSHLLSLK